MTQIGRSYLVWKGDAVKAKLRLAIKQGVDYTLAKCVATAKSFHEYHSRTGHMEMSVAIFEMAHQKGPGTIGGTWGAHAAYALFLEIGTSRPWSGAPRAQLRAMEGHGQMWDIPPPQPPGPHTDTSYTTSVKTAEAFHGIPGADLGGFLTRSGKYRIGGEGPLMEPRMSLRPAAETEYPLLAARIRAFYNGDPVP